MREVIKCLIVNADDFGLSHGVNEGVVAAHEHGILTSASLMVRWAAAAEAADIARDHPELSVGLHLDLGEWTYEDENWRQAYAVVPLDDTEIVAREVARQFAEFERIMGHPPTHLDSHQHVHQTEPIRSLCLEAARNRGIVLRNLSDEVRYRGDFYGQSNTGYAYPEGISVPGFLGFLKSLAPGVTELGCHPATQADMAGMYRQERIVECETLCHPAVREAIAAEGIHLRSFANWPAHGNTRTR